MFSYFCFSGLIQPRCVARKVFRIQGCLQLILGFCSWSWILISPPSVRSFAWMQFKRRNSTPLLEVVCVRESERVSLRVMKKGLYNQRAMFGIDGKIFLILFSPFGFLMQTMLVRFFHLLRFWILLFLFSHINLVANRLLPSPFIIVNRISCHLSSIIKVIKYYLTLF